MYHNLTQNVYPRLYQNRRVFPKSAQDIGTWQSVFELITLISVPANAALVVFTMRIFDSKSIYVRFWLFIGVQWLVFTIQGITKAAIPDTPQEVVIQEGRNQFIVSKLISYAPDDLDEEAVNKSHKLSISSVQINEEYPTRNA